MSEAPEKEFLPKEKKKNTTVGWWIKTILLLLLIGGSIAIMFTLGQYVTESQISIAEMVRGINYRFFAILIAVVVFYVFVESFKYSYMLKIYTGRFRLGTAFKTMFLGKYYDGITPLSTGGQPFQIYYLHKKNISKGAATAIPILRYIVGIFILTALSVVLLAIAPDHIPQDTVGVTTRILAWISLAINFTIPLTVIFFSFFPKLCKRVIAGIVKLLYKMRIVKRQYAVTLKYLREMSEYSKTIKQFFREFHKHIPLVILSIVEVLMFVTIPFFVVIAIANVEPSFELVVQIACLVIITRYVALLIPTPGNSGALEATGFLVFATVPGIGHVVGWVMLVWRFVNYYMYILSGIGINIFEIARSAYRNKKANRQLG